MKVLGMIGGTGPESTMDYYRLVHQVYRVTYPKRGYPHIILDSIDGHHVLNLLQLNRLAAVTDYLLQELHRLEQAGAGVAILTSNMLHILFDELEQVSLQIELVSIVEAVTESAKSMRLTRVGLLGTARTMQSGMYQTAFERAGMDIFVPDSNDQQVIDTKYFSELVRGEFRAETRDQFVHIIGKMQKEKSIEGLILGGTELPLLMREADEVLLPMLDSTLLHVQRVVAEL
jgi:aspartate racemase